MYPPGFGIPVIRAVSPFLLCTLTLFFVGNLYCPSSFALFFLHRHNRNHAADQPAVSGGPSLPLPLFLETTVDSLMRPSAFKLGGIQQQLYGACTPFFRRAWSG